MCAAASLPRSSLSTGKPDGRRKPSWSCRTLRPNRARADSMNANLARLQPYPFQKLGALLKGAAPRADLRPINLSIGEPKHPTPEFIKRALTDSLDALASYPPTAGGDELRNAIARWLERRHHVPRLDPARQVLPVNGSREALFAFAPAVVDGTRPNALVV